MRKDYTVELDIRVDEEIEPLCADLSPLVSELNSFVSKKIKEWCDDRYDVAKKYVKNINTELKRRKIPVAYSLDYYTKSVDNYFSMEFVAKPTDPKVAEAYEDFLTSKDFYDIVGDSGLSDFYGFFLYDEDIYWNPVNSIEFYTSIEVDDYVDWFFAKRG